MNFSYFFLLNGKLQYFFSYRTLLKAARVSFLSINHPLQLKAFFFFCFIKIGKLQKTIQLTTNSLLFTVLSST